MKDYRSQFDALRFSPEEKQAMIDDLLATAPETRRRVSHKKRIHVLIAAVIAAALCAACASGALQAAIQSLSFFLGNQPEQTQVLGEMAQPIGASVTDNGVTLTVDAVLGDANSYAILYTLSRDDGGPLFPGLDEQAVLSLTDFRFDDGMTTTEPESLKDAMKNGDGVAGSGWGTRFTRVVPGDNAIHFFDMMHWPTLDGMRGPATATFTNLRAKTVSLEIPEEELCIEGNWTVDFQIDYKDASRYLPTGQVFHGGEDNVLTGTIQAFRISPLSLRIEYTAAFDEEALIAQYPDDPRSKTEPLDEWLDNKKIDIMTDLCVIITFQDGTEEEVCLGGDLTGRKEGKAILSGTFDKILPLDTVKSIAIGDLTIPMPQS